MYGSLLDADAFFASNDLSANWQTFTNLQKTRALNRATFLINTLAFDGEKVDFSQENEFPRVAYYNFTAHYFDVDRLGSIVVPKKVIAATYLQAQFILESIESPQISALLQGITSQSIGATSESYDLSLLPIDTKTLLSRQVSDMLKHFLISGF